VPPALGVQVLVSSQLEVPNLDEQPPLAKQAPAIPAPITTLARNRLKRFVEESRPAISMRAT
jgi:hypothetical protein